MTDRAFSHLESWIRARFAKYEITARREGTYGVVFVLSTSKEGTVPRTFALKTINIKRSMPNQRELVIRNFERELNTWHNVPFHHNVLPALGVEVLPAPSELGDLLVKIPLVRMPYCATSLREWVGEDSFVDRVDRLAAIAQAANGLGWLYRHGIQGHGDLKPENILVGDLRADFALPDDDSSWPSTRRPWRIRVADLGWADAWVDLGFADKAWRPYLAPERFEGRVVPTESDMFSLGVIASELLQGVHPAGDQTERLDSKWSRSDWRNWAETGTRDLEKIEPSEVRSLIRDCLDADPAERPSVQQIIAVLSAVLLRDWRIPLAEALKNWNKQAESWKTPLDQAWALEQGARASPEALNAAILKLTQRISELGSDLETLPMVSVAEWLISARSLNRLALLRGTATDWRHVSELALRARTFLLRASNLDLRPYVYPSIISYMNPREVIDEFLREAIAQLSAASGQAEIDTPKDTQ